MKLTSPDVLTLWDAETVVRQELKFTLSSVTESEHEFSLKLKNLSFREEHPECRVHNTYWDTQTLSHFHAHMGGVSNRMKVRLRWYKGLRPLDPRLEFKAKRSNLIHKRVFQVNTLAPETFMNSQMFRNTGLDERLVNYLGELTPTLCNSYLRRYFVSRTHKLRITVDKEQVFSEVHAPLSRSTAPASQEILIELKFAEEDQDEARSFCSQTSLRSLAHSKYIRGVELVSRA